MTSLPFINQARGIAAAATLLLCDRLEVGEIQVICICLHTRRVSVLGYLLPAGERRDDTTHGG